MPSEEHRTLVIEALEPRLLLATVYGFIGSSTSSPAPQAPWVLTGNVGDRHMMEAGVSAIPPVSGYVDGLGSGVTTTFTLDDIPEHTELELQVGVRGKQTYPIGGGGPGEEDPPPEGVWRFDVWFGEHHRWWNTDGSGWGGDPWQFVHHDESFAVTVKGTWLSAGAAPGWYLESASVLRYTPTVFMYEVDTATEGASYTTGNEPGFVIWRSGDTNLSALEVNLSDATGSATPGSDYTSLPSTATIPVGQSQVRVPVLPTDDAEREWTEDVIVSLQDGNYYVPGTVSPVKVHIQDNDPVDIEADGLPEEAEDPEYNETNPGLHLVLNDDDDDQNGTIDGWDDPVPTFDDELEDVTLRFPDEYKVIGTPPNEQEAVVTLSLSSSRFRVWYSGELLLGGPHGPLSVVLDHASLGPEMTVQVEFVPTPPPEPSPPYSPYVAEAPFTPVSGNLSLQSSDVGPRGSGSTDVLLLQGKDIVVELDDPALTPDQEARYGAFVMINADNDNGSPVAEMWPETRDFEVASGAQYAQGGVEDDLKELQVILRGAVLPMWVKLTWPNMQVRVFRNADKTDEMQSGDLLTVNQQESFYVEGINISSSLKSITFTAQLLDFAALPVPGAVGKLRAAVGPVLAPEHTRVVKGGPPGLRTPTNIISSSPQFHATGSAQDAAFWVQHYFYYHPVYELPAGQMWPLAYFQTARITGESPHLTFAPSGKKLAWRFVVNEEVQNAGAIFVDSLAAAHFPYANAPLSGITDPNEAGERFLTTAFADTPQRGFFGNGDPGDNSVVFDFGSEYRSHLVLPLQGGVYYPLGHMTWTVRYAGTLTSGPEGFTFAPVAANNKVEAGDFIASSLKPNYTHYLQSAPHYDLIPWP